MTHSSRGIQPFPVLYIAFVHTLAALPDVTSAATIAASCAQSNPPNIGPIIGAIFGVVAFFAIVSVLIAFARRGQSRSVQITSVHYNNAAEN
ncbi:hypothetical protein B0H16DRAFT_1504217, partial [Mycena metata]